MKFSKENIAYLQKNYGINILPLSKIGNENWPGTKPIEIFFFYKTRKPIWAYKESLLKIIEHYNLFSSSLIMVGENEFALQYCTSGVVPTILPFVNDTSDNVNIDDMKKMMVHVKTLPGEPLFAVTGMPMKDGTLVGVSCSHAVADGISILLFLYAWCCLSEDMDFLTPSTQRLFKGKPVSLDKIDKVFIPSVSELSDKIQNRVKNMDRTEAYSTREYFSDEFLKEMKNKAMSENDKYIISDNQIMNSILLKKYHDIILPHTDKVRLRIPINLRDVHPDIDSTYIGYAVFNSVAEFTKNEIKKMSIPQIAYRIKESIDGIRNESYVKEILYMSDNYGLDYRPENFKNYTPFNANTDISSVSLTHFSDFESLGFKPDLVNFLHVELPLQPYFTMLKENSGRIFAQITSKYPLL